MRGLILLGLVALGVAAPLGLGLPMTGALPLTRMERAKGVGLQMNINKPIDLSLPGAVKFTGKPSDPKNLVEKSSQDNSAALAAINKDDTAPVLDMSAEQAPAEEAAPATPAAEEASLATEVAAPPGNDEIAAAPPALETPAAEEAPVATEEAANAPPQEVKEAPAAAPAAEEAKEAPAAAPAAEEAKEDPVAAPAAEEAKEAPAAAPAAEEAKEAPAAAPAAEEAKEAPAAAPVTNDEVAAPAVEDAPQEKATEPVVTKEDQSSEPEIDHSDFSGLSEPEAPPAVPGPEVPAAPVAALEEAAIKEVEDMQKKKATVDLSKPSWNLMAPKDGKKKGDKVLQNLDHESSTIKGRIFDSEYEKQDFEARKHEMKVKFNKAITKAERVAACTGNCGEGMRLFTVWTTAASTWNPKYTRSVDSALFHHPKAKVTVYSSALPLNFLDDFTKLGYDVAVEPINLAERAKGTPLEEWAQNLKEHQDGPFYYAHLSDAARMVVLYQEGGVYFDTDVVFVNPMDNVHNVVGWERPDSICNAMLAFDKGNTYMRAALTEFNDYYVKDEWAENGPVLLTRLYNEKFHGDQSVHVLGKSAFYLISWTEIQKYFQSTSSADKARDFKLLKSKAYAVHFWNSRSHDLVVDPSSLMAKLFTEACVYCEDISDEIMSPIMSHQESEAKEMKLYF